MKNPGARSACLLAVVGALAAATPVVSQAEGSSDDWTFSATIYGWLPSIDGNLSVPVETGGSSVGVDPSAILDALNFTFMGMFEADKGRWGAATDLIYLDLGGSKKKVRDFTVGDVDLPGSTTVDASLDITGWLWTLDGTYLVVEDPDHPVKLLAGARMLDMTTDLKWKLEGDISGLPLPGREGKGEASDTVWDAIVGVKGKFVFGDDRKWFVPYYLDVGTGDSDLTWQGMLGAGYAFDWGDLVAVWRYLDYNMPSGKSIEDLSFSGAAIGATFHF
jgi:hypothetical protein